MREVRRVKCGTGSVRGAPIFMRMHIYESALQNVLYRGNMSLSTCWLPLDLSRLCGDQRPGKI